MKIEIKKQTPTVEKLTFADLKPGEVFVWNFDVDLMPAIKDDEGGYIYLSTGRRWIPGKPCVDAVVRLHYRFQVFTD